MLGARRSVFPERKPAAVVPPDVHPDLARTADVVRRARHEQRPFRRYSYSLESERVRLRPWLVRARCLSRHDRVETNADANGYVLPELLGAIRHHADTRAGLT
jgi:hypothetical protein